MKKFISGWMGIAVLMVAAVQAENEGLHVYSAVPGLAPSEHYQFRVRTVGSSTWLDAFAFITRCKAGGENSAYYEHLEDWSNSYINFEMLDGVPVEIEITKVDGSPIETATAHPAHRVNSCEVANGKAYVVLEKPALFAVDIDGQMNEQDTGRIQPTGWGDNAFYGGPPIHTVTIFANPFLTDKPLPTDSDVWVVQPGDTPPSEGSWDVLYFMPGVHDIGLSFNVHAEKHYYIPGDAIVHGTFNNQKIWNDGHSIRIYGHGTLSGERYPHPNDAVPPAPDEDDWQYKPIDIVGARNTSVEGITITDSPMHSLMLINSYQPESPTEVRWVKIFTWRANGDGINPFGNTLIEDCFIRTQDDCLYVNGRGIRRVVLWADANGSSFVLSPVGNTHGNEIVVEDCDVIYNRSIFYQNKGGRVFNLRGEGSGDGGSNIVFRNIRVSDPRPTRSAFGILSAAPWQKSPTYEQSRGAGVISGILFENIDIAARSTIGDPDTLWGTALAPLRSFTFDTVTVAGEWVSTLDDFNHNTHVSDMVFQGPPSLLYSTNTLHESIENDGRVAGSVRVTLWDDLFTQDVVSGGHVRVEQVPLGLTPVYSRESDTEILVMLRGRALDHGERDGGDPISIIFSDHAFASVTAADVVGATNPSIQISYKDPVPPFYLVDSFSDGSIEAVSDVDLLGGFDVFKANGVDNGLQVYETADTGVLDLSGATTDFPWIAMVSQRSFDAESVDSFKLTVEVDELVPSHWYLRPFTINLRPNNSPEPTVYNPETITAPKGISLMVGNGVANCRVALVASDGTTSNWLWEDTQVTQADLADGFSVSLTVDRSNGWTVTFSGAESLPETVSGNWGSVGWNALFSETTFVQAYLREDMLSGKSPPRVGTAKVAIDLMEVSSVSNASHYQVWTDLWSGVDLSDGQQDFDLDGVSNRDEYAFNGNPIDAQDTGLVLVQADGGVFTVVHPAHQLDSDLTYRLMDKTNLVSETWQTNTWDSRTIGSSSGEYTMVSNHYSTTNILHRFIQIEVD
tara:strand:- start:1715 stop:4777 length:3063 start_codon:yes stop_codon:yes gene_type:complete